jgi:catalase
VPLRRVGKMTLDRNPDNYFAETEQAAFHVGHVVPGIDFTDDPLMQGRLFSYTDTQLIRLGGPNFEQLPVNQAVAPVTNNQRQGYGQQRIDDSDANYYPNTIAGGCPALATDGEARAFRHYAEQIDGRVVRARAEKFADHYSQSALFWNSMHDWERDHIVAAARFELGKVTRMPIRERTIEQFNEIDHDFATRVAAGIGVAAPGQPSRSNNGRSSAALSLDSTVKDTITTRQVAVLAADGVDAASLRTVTDALTAEGAVCEVLAAADGTIAAESGGTVDVARAAPTVASVLYDAVLVPGGEQSAATVAQDGIAMNFVTEAFAHGKPIAAFGAGVDVLRATPLPTAAGVRIAGPGGGLVAEQGVVTTTDGGDLGGFARAFRDGIAVHRHHDRSTASVPA